MYGESRIGQQLGLTFGSFLGRQIALGACHDDPDDDFERRAFPVRESALPAAVDLRGWMTPVEDQGQLGSCTSNALAGAVEYLVRRETGRAVDLSRLFVYYNQRLWGDYVRDDGGGAIAVGVRVLARLGIPTESSWPYRPELFAVQPTAAVYAEAEKLQATDWWYVPIDERAIRGCLAAGFPIAFGTRCTQSFMDVPASGVVPLPRASESSEWKHGRHALLLCGYDDARRLFVIRNSWGADWGDRGYGYLPYEWVLNREWTRSAWAVRLTERPSFEGAGAATRGVALPVAPPSGSGASGGAGAAASVLGTGAQLAVGMLTGSGLLAGLAGGIVAGITPGVATRLSGRDVGAVVGTDRSAEILAAMRAGGAPPPRGEKLPWDDGLDEEAVAEGGLTRTSGVRAQAGGEGRVGGASATSTSTSTSHSVAPSPQPAPVGRGSGSGVGGAIGAGIAAIAAAVTPAFSPAPVPAPAPIPSPTPTPTPAPSGLPPDLDAAWRAAGGPAGPLGAFMPPLGAMSEGNASGIAARFAGGGIFTWRGAAPIVLRASDRLYQHWLAAGAARSALGWPVAAPTATPDGIARALPCTRGAAFDHPRLGTHALTGALYAYWQSLGAFTSGLGHLVDVSMPADPNGEQLARFEHGTLAWSPAGGARRG
jgi:hypothetical protein